MAPPSIVSIRPESGAVVPNLRGSAVIQFDEVIEEQAGGDRAGGPAGLGRLVLLSPVAGDVKVSWHRTAIRVQPKEGWRPGRVYHLQLLAGITDLRRNRLDTGRTVLFSTGPPIPDTRLTGTVLHWTEQHALRGALVLAARRPDTVSYIALADSAGDFALAGLPPGDYAVVAARDDNGNRRVDRREAHDTARVRLDSSATLVIWAFVHDSTAPRLRSADPVDSMTVRLSFTQALDPTVALGASLVRILALPDSTAVPLAAVLTPPVYDSLAARERAAADSARAAADTTRARGDTAGAQARPRPPVRARPDARARVLAEPTDSMAEARAADTARIRSLLAARPIPYDRRIVRTAVPLVPGARYLVRVLSATNLSGAADSSHQVLIIPEPRTP